MKNNVLGTMAALGLWVCAGPALAQYDFTASVIGTTLANMGASNNACLSGTPLPDSEVREADAPAKALMSSYWQRARTSDPAALSDIAWRSSKLVESGAETKLRSAALPDSFARDADNVLLETPLTIVRSGYGHLARGVWEVKRSDGSHVGYYVVDILRDFSWKILRLELLSKDAPIPEVGPYCSEQGDIEKYKIAVAEQEAKRAQRKAEKEARIAAANAERDARRRR
jgi:hypothetical protein